MSQQNESVWKETTPPQCPRLLAPRHFDVVIVGGGITGLTAAYLLKQAGKKVCVLERDPHCWRRHGEYDGPSDDGDRHSAFQAGAELRQG